MKTVSLSDALGMTARRPGLLIGPDATCVPGSLDLILNGSLSAIGAPRMDSSDVVNRHFRSSMDRLKTKLPDQYERLRAEIMEQLRLLKPSLDLPYLARSGWSACISLTDDLLFEGLLRDHLDSTPSSVTATIIDEPGVVPPDRTIPIYKLMGTLNSLDPVRRLAISDAELAVRQQRWAGMLRTAPDVIRDAPLLIVGTESVVASVRQVLAVLAGQSRPHVSRLFFLASDKTLQDDTVLALCENFETTLVDASLRDLCGALAELKPARKELAPPLVSRGSMETVALASDRLVSVVPTLQANVGNQNILSLIDGLFRPTAIDWQPFAAKIDLRRTATDQLLEVIGGVISARKVGSLGFVRVRGEAGVGKTILMKRAAYELAESGALVLWCKRASPGWPRHFRKLARELSDACRQDSANPDVVIFCDDPWGLRLDAADLMSCFDQFAGRATFVFTERNSDYFSDQLPLRLPQGASDEIELPFELDSEEWAGLATMLLQIKAASSPAEAERLLGTVPARNARDILCSLWYLVPETQYQLSESLRDEYCRLGSPKNNVDSLAQLAAKNSEVAKRAYEFVTVTSYLDIGLPVEVLVRALEIDYSEWIEMIVDGRPLWGLLYDEQDPSTQNVFFRTRNEVVTRVLLELVNGGVGHAGEFRVLKELIKACDGGTAVYRNFVVDILVRSRARLQKMLTYAQGIELFDLARVALEYDDRLLEHHRGIWIDDVGGRPLEAYRQLERALHAEIHPSSDRDTPVEHIHTSMASAIVKMISSGEQDPVTGFQTVRDHLRQAATSKYFNAHTAHVSANLLFELAQMEGSSTHAVHLGSISDALQEIERAFQLIGGQAKNHFRDEKSIAMLGELQRRIVRSVGDSEQQRELAKRIYRDTREQTGFEAIGRCLLAEAASDDKGSSYNRVNEYLDECDKFLQSVNDEPTMELLAVRADLIIRWRIQRFLAVEWSSFVATMKRLVNSSRYSDDAIKTFYLAVGLFHTGALTEAGAIFAGLRRLSLPAATRDIRCCYMGKEGAPKRVQGTLERKHDYGYLMLSDLDLSVPMRSMPQGYGTKQTIHAYIVFTLNGPAAELEKPDVQQVKLP